MLQRIQTLYLLGAIIAFVLMAFFPLGYMMMNGHPSSLGVWGIQLTGMYRFTAISAGIFVISLICEIIAIFLYGNRILQMRLTIFNIVLQIGFYISTVAHVIVIGSDTGSSFSFNWALLLPLLTMVLNVLAYRAIHKDEKLVRSLNHLR